MSRALTSGTSISITSLGRARASTVGLHWEREGGREGGREEGEGGGRGKGRGGRKGRKMECSSAQT